MELFWNLSAKPNLSDQNCVSEQKCMLKSIKMERLLFLCNSVCPNFLQLSIDKRSLNKENLDKRLCKVEG